MRKVLLLGSCIAVLGVALPPPARPSAYTAEPCLKSKLCVGLVDHFKFEEPSDFARYGAFGSTLHEAPGANLGNIAGKIGNAANFTGGSNDYLWSSTFVPAMGSNWSMAVWLRPAALPTGSNVNYVLGRNYPGANPGTQLYLDPAGNLCLYVQNKEASSAAAACVTVSAGTIYFIAFGVGDPDDTPGALQAWISKDGLTKVTSTLSFIPAAGLSHSRVGQIPANGKGASGISGVIQGYNGWLDELSVFGRSIGAADISLLYNGGPGRTYPFETE